MKKILVMSLMLVYLPAIAKQMPVLPRVNQPNMNDPKLYPINMVRGKEITPSSLVKLCRPPAKVQQLFETWVKNNPLIIKKLVQFDKVGDWKIYLQEGREALAKAGIKNLSKHNYVFRLPNAPQYMVQIAGPMNKVLNVIYANKMGHDTWEQKRDDVEYLNSLQKPLTYQTISRAANYLKFNEAVKLLKMRDKRVLVETKPTYMVAIPGALGPVSDQTYVVIQEAYKDDEIKLVNANLDRVKDISQPAIEQLLDVILHVGLWAIEDNLLITKDGRLMVTDLEQHKLKAPRTDLAFVDLEQPNLSSPYDFYHKNMLIFNHEVVVGIEGLLRLLRQSKNTDKYPIVKQWIDDNEPIFKEFESGKYGELQRVYQEFFGDQK